MSIVSDEQLDRAWTRPPGVIGFISAVNNSTIGPLFIAAAWGFFLLAGIDSLVIRTQLAVPEAGLVGPQGFNALFTTHGTAMMFLFAVPMLEALAIFILPLVLGTRDMSFPRMSAFTFWTFVFSGLLFYGSTLPDVLNFVLPGNPLPFIVPNVGWFAYPPLSSREYSPGLNVDFYLIGLGAAEFAGLGASIEIIVTILKTRAPGMSLSRLPLFAWGMLVMAFAMLFAFPAVIVSSTLLELERKFGMPFYDPALGGDPLLWQHLFWIFGHPEVYIMFIPATGIVSMIVPAFTGRPLAGYVFVAMAIAATGFLSFGLWVHHMFTVGLPLLPLALFGASSMMIAIPSGIQVFSWIATILNGKRLAFDTPMLYVIGFIITFVIGGLTGVMVASVPFDWQVHDTYFVVAHFHYVLVGGVVLPIFAAFYYWMPKITGRMYDERWGKASFWLFFIGLNLAFLPQHNAGLLGMPRRVYTYSAELGIGGYNLVSTIGAYLMGLGVLAFLWSLYRSYTAGAPAPRNPWNAGTVDWTTEADTPASTFRKLPLVRSHYPAWDGDLETWVPEQRMDGDPAPARIWRETVGTTVMDGRPESIVRIAGPSLLPFASGVTVSLVSVGLLFDWYWLIAISLVASVVLVGAWLWPSREERELPGIGATLGYPALPAHTSGPMAVGWWAMALTVAALAITFAYLLFSYFYLLAGQTEWPFGGIAPPGPLLPAVGAALLILSTAPMRIAELGIRRGGQSALRIGVAGTTLLGLLFFAVEVMNLLNIGFAPQVNAYTALYYTVAGFLLLLVAVGIGMLGFVQARAWLGHFDHQRCLAVQNTAMYWYFVVIAWLTGAATIYLVPHLL